MRRESRLSLRSFQLPFACQLSRNAKLNGAAQAHAPVRRWLMQFLPFLVDSRVSTNTLHPSFVLSIGGESDQRDCSRSVSLPRPNILGSIFLNLIHCSSIISSSSHPSSNFSSMTSVVILISSIIFYVNLVLSSPPNPVQRPLS